PPRLLRVPDSIHTSPLSLHDALPISGHHARNQMNRQFGLSGNTPKAVADTHAWNGVLPSTPTHRVRPEFAGVAMPDLTISSTLQDRKSTRLNSSHVSISYAVFCLKKK